MMRGLSAIFQKELLHIRRDRTTVFFTIVVPALQLVLFGYAANVTIDNIPAAVMDLDGRRESRRLIEAMQNTRAFRVVEQATSAESLRRAVSSGRAKVAVIIPPDFTERLVRGREAPVQVLVDGSDSQVASTAVNTVGLLGTSVSMERAKAVGERARIAAARGPTGQPAMPLDMRSRVLFNPDLEDSWFFVPGLVAIILQVVLSFLTAGSIVRERENGTLEQLFVTPVSAGGLLMGKLSPYAMLAGFELLVVLAVMVGLFGVPIQGSLALLVLLAGLFILTALGLGLMISTIARTQFQAMQFAWLVMLPSVLLSGFVFPRSEMPWPLYWIGALLPVTYFLEIVRGIVLRNADAADLLGHMGGLAACAAVIVTVSLARFRKQLD